MLLEGFLFLGLSAVVMGVALWVGTQRACRRIAWEARLGRGATPQSVVRVGDPDRSGLVFFEPHGHSHGEGIAALWRKRGERFGAPARIAPSAGISR
jgi:hypothetical protein